MYSSVGAKEELHSARGVSGRASGRGPLYVDSAGRESSGLGMESTMAPISATAPEIWW